MRLMHGLNPVTTGPIGDKNASAEQVRKLLASIDPQIGRLSDSSIAQFFGDGNLSLDALAQNFRLLSPESQRALTRFSTRALELGANLETSPSCIRDMATNAWADAETPKRLHSPDRAEADAFSGAQATKRCAVDRGALRLSAESNSLQHRRQFACSHEPQLMTGPRDGHVEPPAAIIRGRPCCGSRIRHHHVVEF
jgi:hypothetical protein